MLRTLCVSLVALAIVSPAFTADKELPKDLAAIQGKWKIVKLSYSGKDVAAEAVAKKNAFYEFKGDENTATEDGQTKKACKFQVDGSKSPALITLDTPGMGKLFGIYKIEKNTLTICYGLDQSKRPTKFESTKDALVILMVLEKVK